MIIHMMIYDDMMLYDDDKSLTPACDALLVLCCQVRVLLKREYWATTRNPTDVAGRTLLYVWVAMVIGIIYYNLDYSFEALR